MPKAQLPVCKMLDLCFSMLTSKPPPGNIRVHCSFFAVQFTNLAVRHAITANRFSVMTLIDRRSSRPVEILSSLRLLCDQLCPSRLLENPGGLLDYLFRLGIDIPRHSHRGPRVSSFPDGGHAFHSGGIRDAGMDALCRNPSAKAA